VFTNADEMLQTIVDEAVEQVDFKVTDLLGRWHHLTFSTTGIDIRLLTEGSGLSMSPYPGYRQIQQSDMVAVPDPTTAFLDPFYDRKTLSVICDIRYPDGRPYERNPRDIARRAEAQLARAGIDGSSAWLPEMEFYIFDGARYGSGLNQAYYELHSKTGSWVHDPEQASGLGYKLPDTGVGQIDAPRDRFANLRSEMVRHIENAGYPVKYNHHEVGAGQCEIEPKIGGLLHSADSVMVMRYVIHRTAIAANQTVTFLPKPVPGIPGNGMHFHQYLEKDGRSLFYGGPKCYGSLNRMGFQYAAGLLHHTPALMALCCPTTNSYRRFGVGLAAPMNLFFSEANRTAAVRIPAYDETPEGERIEYRLPDALCNPYLAIAAQLLAGVDGIKKKMDPTKLGYGPLDVNNYELSPEERAKIKSGPTSLLEALNALKRDHAFLTAGRVFPKDLIATWIDLKMQELDDIAKLPHPREFELYYDF